MGLTISGLGSGLDISSIVTSLVSAEFDPKTQAITKQQTKNSSELSAFGSLSSSMDAMNTAAQALTKDGVFDSMSATSSNSSAISISASTKAGVGNYDISVLQLATANKVQSGIVSSQGGAGQTASDVGTGSMTISNGVDENGDPKSFSVDIVAGENGTASLKDIADAINNSKENTGVTASIVNSSEGSYLTFTSKETGAENNITVSTNADDSSSAFAGLGSNLKTLQAGQDAEINIDGVSITSASNTITSAIDGVTLTLNGLTKDESGTDAPAKINVTKDTSSAEQAIQKFVDAFNGYRDTSGGLTVYSPSTGISGPLNGDSTARSAMSSTSRLLHGEMGGNNSVQALSDLGISFDDDGGMVLDSSKLKTQLEKDPDAVQAFFVGSDPKTDAAGKTTYGTEGLASKMQSLTDGYSGQGGAFSTRLTSLASQNDTLDKDMVALNKRMAAYQTTQTAKYNAMDLAISRMQSQLSYVTALFQ